LPEGGRHASPDRMNPDPSSPPIGRRENARCGAGLARQPPRLAREIFVVLAVKAVALSVIWWVWFSAPEATHMRLPPERVQHRLVQAPIDGTSVAAAPAVPTDSPAGNHAHAPD